MFIKFETLTKRLRSKESEQGFTLLELLIVLAILGIIVAIAVPLFANQTRVAIAATVQSDVRNSADVLFESKNFPTQEQFAQRSVTTDKNLVGLIVNNDDPKNPTACVWGSRTLTSTDIISYHFSTADMVVKKGFCDSTVPPIVGTPETPVTPPVTPTTPDTGSDQSGVTQQANVTFTPHYYPQNNSINFCYSVDVSANARVAWEYKLDLSKGPFWGTSHTTFGSQYNYYVKSVNGNIVTLSGTPGGWNEFTGPGESRSFGFCSQNTNEPPLNTNWFTTTVTPSASNSIWYACVDIRTTSTSIYPVPWKKTINLNDYFHSITGKTPTFVNLTKVDKGNNIYEITGSGWNSYASVSEPRTFSASICYNPNGQPW